MGFVSPIPGAGQLQKPPPSGHKPALTPQLEFQWPAILGGLFLLLMALSWRGLQHKGCITAAAGSEQALCYSQR